MTAQRLPDALFGAAAATLGAFVILGARRIPVGFSYDAVGPALFPTMIGVGLLLSGLAILLSVWRTAAETVNERSRFNWTVVAVISAALLLEALLITRLGWIPMIAVVFAAGAYAFGDNRILLNLMIGFALGALTMLAFSFGIGIDLPLGPLEPLLQRFR